MSTEPTDPAETPAETQADTPPEPDFVESPTARRLRLLAIQDQVYAAAEKVNLLIDMGLSNTAGYGEAKALYATRLADFNALKAELGM